MTNNTPAQQEAAIQEGERIAAADEYFKARAWIMDTNDNRRIFEAGFDRAYALLSKLRAEGVQAGDEREAFDAVAGLVPPCATRRGNNFREGYLEAKVDALRVLRSLANAPVSDEQLRIEFTASGVGYVSIEKARAAVEAARKASAPVADEQCRACNPQVISVEQLEKDPLLVARLWRKPADTDGSLLERILEHVSEYGESMASSSLLSVRTIARRNLEARIEVELADAMRSQDETPLREALSEIASAWSARTRMPEEDGIQALKDIARAALASAPADPEAAEVDFLVRVLENLDTWRAEEWSELLERRPAILAMLRPMVLASAPATCSHQFHFFGDQKERRCNRCNTLEPKASAPVAGEARPSILRFNPIAGLGMNPASNGMYVRYEDHAEMLSRYAAPQASATIKQSLNVAPQASEAVRDAGITASADNYRDSAHFHKTASIAELGAWQRGWDDCRDFDDQQRAALSAQPSGNPGELAAQPGAQKEQP